jgi:uncharacterized protein YjbK
MGLKKPEATGNMEMKKRKKIDQFKSYMIKRSSDASTSNVIKLRRDKVSYTYLC